MQYSYRGEVTGSLAPRGSNKTKFGVTRCTEANAKIKDIF